MFYKLTNFFVILLVVIATGLTWLVLPQTTVSGSDVVSNTLVELLNDTRTRQGLVAVKNNPQLQEAARRKGEDMLSKKYWAHFGPNKESPWDFILKMNYNYEYAGENLAKGFTTSEAVHTAWLNSPTHRDNLLNPYYDEVGIAVLYGEVVKGEGQVILVVQMFGSRFAGRKVPDPQQDVQAKVAIESPTDGSVVSSPDITVRGTAQGVKPAARIEVGNSPIAEIGISDQRFTYQTQNVFDAAPLVIKVSGTTDANEARSSTITVFNNPNDYLQEYYRQRLSARPADNNEVVLAAPVYRNVLGVKLESCQVDYPFTEEEGEWRIKVTAEQYSTMSACTNILHVQVPPTNRLPLSLSALPPVIAPPAVAGVTTTGSLTSRIAHNGAPWAAITVGILAIIAGIVSIQVVVALRRNHLHLHHHYFALVLLFLISGLVKLFFSNGTII